MKRDRTGERYGRLLVIKRDHGKYWECLCDCGKTCVVNSDHLGRDTNSCGCLRKEISGARQFVHGGKRLRLYKLWTSIKARCNNPKGSEHETYYDRGIRLCDTWNKDFAAFREWAIANGYDPNAPRGTTTIDRIDNNKGYSPENCRFVTLTENARNKQNTRRFVFDGKLLTVGEVSERTGTSMRLISERLRRGWSIKDAALKPRRVMHYAKGGTNYGK